MHIIMSFLGCIGTLMKGSGLDTLFGSAFGGLTGLMSGKVRAMMAFRMVSAALLENFLQANENNFDDILAHIEDARKHPPGRPWVNNLLMPTLLDHHFLRAEREGSWLFQQLCIEHMLLYLFSAGHIHYACYVTWYLLEMRHLLPDTANADLIAGAHVCHHSDALICIY